MRNYKRDNSSAYYVDHPEQITHTEGKKGYPSSSDRAYRLANEGDRQQSWIDSVTIPKISCNIIKRRHHGLRSIHEG